MIDHTIERLRHEEDAKTSGYPIQVQIPTAAIKEVRKGERQNQIGKLSDIVERFMLAGKRSKGRGWIALQWELRKRLLPQGPIQLKSLLERPIRAHSADCCSLDAFQLLRLGEEKSVKLSVHQHDHQKGLGHVSK